MPEANGFLRLALLLAALAVAPAACASSGDLFDDYGVDSSQRPRVPSDEERREDLLPTPPPLLNQNYDLLDSARPVTISPDADMLARRKPRVDYGRDDMFVERPNNQPHYPLFHRAKP